MMTSSDRPRLTELGRILPTAWQAAIRERAGGLDVATLLADLFRSYPPDDLGFDPVIARRAFFLLDRTICRYFRLRVLGTENIPAGRAMIVGCHSGVFAWDAACLVVAVYRHTGRFSRNVGDRFFGRLGPIVPFLKATGLVIGDPERVEACLRRDELVMAFPGGAADMLRPIWRRYQIEPHRGLAPGRGGYIKIALRAESPIVPIAVVGTDDIHLTLGNLPPLARLLGTPFFPVIASPFPLPARIYLRFGKPIHLAAPPAAADDQATVDRLNVEVQGALQALIDDTCRHRRGIYWSRYDGDDGAPPAEGA